MKSEMKDSVQVVIANGGASALTMTECNEILTMISISLAIAFTIYKFIKLKQK
jgi:hypothetical protein|tara:strand:- start:190 stop:348 length:159 start_codon:yes stop_codon:yes gene_type:complete